MLNDVKMNRLSIAERGCWTGILLLAGQSPERGKLLLTETEPMIIDDIASALHLTPEERPALESCISKLVSLNSLRWNEHNCLEVVNFKKRQEVYGSDIPEGELTPSKLRINPELTPIEVEERGEKKEEDVERDTPKGARKKRAGPMTDPRVKEILDEVKKDRGYPGQTDKDPIPSYGKEGQAIKRMLARGFTREEILACWRRKVSQRGGEFQSMVWVNEDIDKKGALHGTVPRASGTGGRYTQAPTDEQYRRSLPTRQFPPPTK